MESLTEASQLRKQGPEKCSDLPKVTQAVRSQTLAPELGLWTMTFLFAWECSLRMRCPLQDSRRGSVQCGVVVGSSSSQRNTEKDNGGHGEVKGREGRREVIKRRGRVKSDAEKGEIPRDRRRGGACSLSRAHGR